MSGRFRLPVIACAIAGIGAFGLAAQAGAAELENHDAVAALAQNKLASAVGAALPAAQQERRVVQVPLAAGAYTGFRAGIEPRAMAQQFLLHDAARHGARVAGADELRAVDLQTTVAGVHIARFKPLHHGVEIFRETVNVLLDAAGNVRTVSGNFSGVGEELAAPDGSRGFRLDARAAVAAALAPYGLDRDAVRQALTARAVDGDYSGFALAPTAAMLVDGLRAKPVYFRMADGLVPAFYVETRVQRAGNADDDMYGHVIAADDGRLLFRRNLIADAAFSYRVFAEDGDILLPFPGPSQRTDFPHPLGTNSGFVPPLLPPQLVTLEYAPLDAVFPGAAPFNDPWLPAGATEATGNNAEAYTDNASPDGFNAGDVRPTVTAPGVFDRSFDMTIAPDANDNQRAAAVLQQFYIVNYMHDWFYRAGFDESAGNAQTDNYGRGGLGGDSIKAQGQDFAGTNNANMATPADGERPRMRMYIFNAPPGSGIRRDGTVDTGVIAHEWGHYISNRLIGDASGLSNQQGGGMGEGWGDFHGMLLLVKQGDATIPSNANFNGTYATGSFATAGLYPAGNQNQSYFGIRRYPYSTDMSKNALTFKHISQNVSLPAGIPRGVIGSADNSEVHNVGEVWASMLWECYAGLLRDSLDASPRHSFDQARRKMSDYLVAGYKLTPSAPTLTEARDALLASMAVSDPQDFAACAAGFAKRGAGLRAVSPPRDSVNLNGVVESYTVGADLEATALELGEDEGCDSDGVLDPGETATVTITVRNTGTTALSGSTVTLASSAAGVSFPDGASANLPSMLPFQQGQATIRVALAAAQPHETVTFTATPDDPNLAFPAGIARSIAASVNSDELPSASESFEAHDFAWSTEFTSGFNPQVSEWQRVGSGVDNTIAHGTDTGGRGLSWMISPPLEVGSGTFGFTFMAAYQFEADASEKYDGGVLEISNDGGTSWSPIAAGAITPGYTGILSNCCNNPLAGRSAFTGTSAGYPTRVQQSVDLGTAYAGQTVQIRFGIATDEAAGADGWSVDDVVFSGLASTPFLTPIVDDGVCAITDRVFADGFETQD